MASKCCRIYNRASISYLKSAILKPSLKATTKSLRIRTPGELGSVASMLPLHSAVAMARMNPPPSPLRRCPQ
ncbi:protein NONRESPONDING TO OXYLIPINS 2, mitochondrial-like [Primulina tabacum]|uniref:protein NONRESPONDING TO OXYLIPINS 2, mitochondrial-like n=1 Tax=Primulina tabacum TaxID=48773 RepID=UPI003F598FFE